MASTDSKPVPQKNVAYRHYFDIRKNDGTLITSWTGADSEVSKDGGSFTDCTNEATEIGTSGIGYIDLTSTEMNADSVILKTTVTNTSALPVVVCLFPEEAGDIRVNATAISGTAQTARDIGASVLLSSGTGTGQVKLSGGYVAPNWGDVGNPTTTLNLSGTTIATTQKVDVETIKTQTVTCAAGVTIHPAVGMTATALANLETVYATDFAMAYNTTTDGWNVNATHWGGTAVASARPKVDVYMMQSDGLAAAGLAVAGNDYVTYEAFPASIFKILATSVTETSAGYLAASFSEMHDVASPVFTTASVNQTGNSYGIVNDGTNGNAAIVTKLGSMSGATFDTSTDSLEAIRNRGDAEWITGSGGTPPTVEEIRAEMDTNSTKLAAIVADTNELQTDWVNGGRLDLIVDAILDDTGTAGVVVASGSKTGYSLTAGTGLGNQTANITGSITNVTGGINTAAGTITTLDALPPALEAAILNEGDATALLAAIGAKVEEFLINEGDATATIAAIATACNSAIVAGTVGSNVTAIKAKTDNLPASPAATGDIPSAAANATAVRSELTTELGRIDAAITTRSSHDAAAVYTAFGTGANLTALTTATGFSTHSAADVVTALGTGTTLTALPWNANWDAEVQSECVDALREAPPADGANVGKFSVQYFAMAAFNFARTGSALAVKSEDGTAQDTITLAEDDTLGPVGSIGGGV